MKKQRFSKAQLEELTKFAGLKLSDARLKSLSPRLAEFMEEVESLNKLPLDEVEPANPLDVWRE